MKRVSHVVWLSMATLFLAACEGDDGADGQPGPAGSTGPAGPSGLNSLTAFRDIPKGDAVCLGGGLAIDSGLDTNQNGILDPEEVTASSILECEATPQVRALHASPDAPAVNIWVNGATALENVDYAQGSGFLPGLEEVNVQVEAIVPGGNLIVIDEDFELDYSTDYTIIAIDNVAGPVRALVVANPSDELLAPDSFFVQVVHAAPSAPSVDVYVTAFGADLGTSAPVTGAGTPLDFEGVTPRLEVPAGAYQIRITPAGDAGTVVYDSGEVDLPAGADLLIAAVDNVGLGESAVQLVVMDGTGASTLYDTNTAAAALALHLSPDAPAVDILADIDATAEDEALKLAENVSFGEYCVIDPVPAPVDFTLSVVANADNDVVALQFPYSSEVDGAVAALVTGFLSSGEPAITAIALGVSPRSIVTEAQLRLTHASPSTPNVDIYLLAAGTDINAADPAFSDVPFGADTGVLSIAAGVWDVYVTATGIKDPAIAVPGVALSGGEVWDVIARDPAGAEVGPQPLVIDYGSDLPACTVAAAP